MGKKRYAIGCFVCGRALANIGNPGGNQPVKGLEFVAAGHYGCTVFDPMDSSFLVINVCDPCMIEKSKAGFVLMGQSIPMSYKRTDYKLAELSQ